MVHRADLERHDPKPGDIWPPDGHGYVTDGRRPARSETRRNMPKLIDSMDMGELFDMLATPTTGQERALELLQVRP
jgi:hypothetical protein